MNLNLSDNTGRKRMQKYVKSRMQKIPGEDEPISKNVANGGSGSFEARDHYH